MIIRERCLLELHVCTWLTSSEMSFKLENTASNHLSAIYIWFSLFWRKQSRDNPVASARGQDGGGRKERFSNRCIKLCVVEGLFTVSRQVAGQLTMPGLTGHSLDTPGRWLQLSPPPRTRAAPGAENAARYPKSIRSESRA